MSIDKTVHLFKDRFNTYKTCDKATRAKKVTSNIALYPALSPFPILLNLRSCFFHHQTIITVTKIPACAAMTGMLGVPYNPLSENRALPVAGIEFCSCERGDCRVHTIATSQARS
jgi:hypothetical protein